MIPNAAVSDNIVACGDIYACQLTSAHRMYMTEGVACINLHAYAMCHVHTKCTHAHRVYTAEGVACINLNAYAICRAHTRCTVIQKKKRKKNE